MTDDSDNISQKFLEEIKNTDVSDIENPHDRLFKWSLGRPDVMMEYLDLMLPEDLANALNFKALDSTKANYVDDLIGETFSDLVYTINKSTGEEAVISLLFEHKSSPDRITPLKLLRYITNAYFDNFKDGKTMQIIPILFYHGSGNWNIPRKLSEVLDGDISPFEDHTPEFEYIFTDLDEAVELIEDTTAPEIRVYFKATQIARTEDIKLARKRYEECLDIFSEPGWTSEILNIRFYQVTNLYIAKVSALAREINIIEIAKDKNPERSEDLMVINNKIEEDKVKRILKRQLGNKFSMQLPPEIETKIENADPEKIEQLVDKIFEIDSLEDVRKILE